MKQHLMFPSYQTSMEIFSRFTYRWGDEDPISVSFEENTFTNEVVEASVVCTNSENRASFAMTVKNISEKPVYMGTLSPLVAENITICATDSRDWMFYRSGRHKNDMPSVCTLGRDDESFADARAVMLETGGGTDDNDSCAGSVELVSDSLSVIVAGDTALLVSFPDARDLLVETRLTLTSDRRVFALSASSEAGYFLRLDPGESLESETVELSADAAQNAERAMEAFAAVKAVKYGARSIYSGRGRTWQNIPSVYCTWYYYGLTVSEDDCRDNLAEIERRALPYEVFQLDEGWERVLGDWRENEKFPSGIKKLAADISAAGLTPGIWTSPFIAHETAPIVAEHGEWFLRKADGEPCLFPMNGTVYRVLDITYPEAVEWVRSIYVKLREDGYRYHKLDFTRAAVICGDAVYHNDKLPLAKAYREAVAVIREAMGEDAYFLMCGGLYDPIIGFVDAQRSGSDVMSLWRRTGGLKNGKTAPYTAKQNLLRWYMRAWWDVDPDALMIRRRETMERDSRLTLGLLDEEEIKVSAANQYIGGGILCSTEPLPQIDDDRLYFLRHVMPVRDVRATPRDLFSGRRYPSLIDAAVYGDDKSRELWHTVLVVNWDDNEKKPLRLKLDEKLLGNFAEQGAVFTVSEFFSGLYGQNIACGDTVEFQSAPLEPHSAAVIKIEPHQQRPMIVGSTAHFSFGAEVETLSLENGVLKFAAENRYPCPVQYKILLPEGTFIRKLPEGCFGSGRELTVIVNGAERRCFCVETGKEGI